MRHTHKSLAGNREGKRPVGRPSSRWEDDVKMNFREVGWQGVDWVHLTSYRDRWRCLV